MNEMKCQFVIRYFSSKDGIIYIISLYNKHLMYLKIFIIMIDKIKYLIKKQVKWIVYCCKKTNC